MSAYTKGNAVGLLLKNALAAEASGEVAVFYWNKKRATGHPRLQGLQLPKPIDVADGVIHRIVDEDSPVKGSVKLSVRDSDNAPLSPQQAEFFKDSKVRDGDGRLMPVYHGSPADFNIFNFDKLGSNGTTEGKGLYFTGSREIAEGYTKGKGKLFETYLNITKPLNTTGKSITKAQLRRFIDAYNKYEAKNDDQGMGMMYYLSNWGDYDREGYQNVLTQAVNAEYDGSENDVDLISGIVNSSGNIEGVYQVLRDTLGYDGIITQWDGEDGKTDIYIVFSPSQIKSTTNLTPTADPDIRYSVRDIEYLAAVESGDMDTAQKLVDEAAREAGYTIKAYHGTTNKIEYADKSKVLSPTEQKAYEDEERAILAEYEKNAKPYLAEENYYAPEFVEVKNTMVEKLEALNAKYGQSLGYEKITIPFALEGNSFDPKKSNDVGTHFASKKETSEKFTNKNGIVFSVYLHGNEVIEGRL